MKRASYRTAVAWIALNDSGGDIDALNEDAAGKLVTSALVADLFGIDDEQVGRDVVRYRRSHGWKEPWTP
jgi:hypothetical protein